MTRVLTCRFSRQHGTARAGTARDLRAVPACRFSTCRLGTYSKTRTKSSNILVKLKNLLEKSLLHSLHDTFLLKDAEEGTVSPLNQNNKHEFEFKFALYVWDLNSRFQI